MPDPKCTFKYNGQVMTEFSGTGKKECEEKRKAFNQFKKERDARARELLGMETKDTTSGKRSKSGTTKKKKSNFLQKVSKTLGIKKKTEAQKERIKQNKANQKKAKNIRRSRRKGLDRNARN